MSVIFTSASALDGRLDYLEGIAFGGLDISGQFAEIGNVTGSLITSASLVSQSVWHLHQFSASVTSSLISLYQTTASLNLFTQSAVQRLNSIELQSGSWITETETGSFLITASVLNDDITFTKGDGSSFTIQINTGSFAETASVAQFANDIIVNVKNTTGGQINKGTIVRIIDATGDNALIQTASWVNDSNSANTLGWVYENIPNDGFGRVITQGTLLGINTQGMTAGQLLYLSSSGQYTNIVPQAPYHEVRIGQVLRQQSNNGSVFVSIMNGYELTELHDVDINAGTLLNNNLVAWNGTSTQWVNRTVTEVGATTTASFNAHTSSTNIRLTDIEFYTSSLKTAIGVNGTNVTVLGDLTVNGTTTQINSTQVNIGENILELNYGGALTKGGIYVKDATGTLISGSLLWDATIDRWVAGPSGSEAKVLTDGMGVISGSGQLGNYETTGRGIVSGSSQIVPLLPAGTISGSSQITYANISSIPAGIVSGAVQITPLLPAGTVSSSAQIDGASIGANKTITIAGTSVTLGGSITLATITGGSGIISGSGQLGNYETTGRGIVSGSSQVTSLLPAGTVSGSSQVIGIVSSLNSYTASNDTTNTSQNTSITNLNNATSSYETKGRGIVSGSSQIVPLLPAGTISGSAQLTNEFDSRYLNTGGDSVISSSAQIGNYVATITGTSNQVVVAGSGNNAAAITLSTPQNIHTAATPQFASLGIGTAASGVTGEIRATADIVAFYSSDERLKENIQPIQNALTKVEAISGNTYDWKEGFEAIHSHKGNDIGVIAQEVEKVLPQVVINRDNGYKAVDYEKIVPLLIEAIKELSAKVKELENK